MGFSLPLSEVAGSNPASPSLGFLGGLRASEEVPEGRRGSWVGQRATESLQSMWSGDCYEKVAFLLNNPLGKSREGGKG
jgi:hypothetical protein